MTVFLSRVHSHFLPHTHILLILYINIMLSRELSLSLFLFVDLHIGCSSAWNALPSPSQDLLFSQINLKGSFSAKSFLMHLPPHLIFESGINIKIKNSLYVLSISFSRVFYILQSYNLPRLSYKVINLQFLTHDLALSICQINKWSVRNISCIYLNLPFYFSLKNNKGMDVTCK